MNRIVLTGDTHGILETRKIIEYQQSEKKLDKDDYLIMCGDCGIVWDKETLKGCIDYYQSFGTNILFIDGNHENFDLLNSFPIGTWHGGKVHKIADNIIHLMRGQIFDLCGKTILTLGGANSTDISSRQEHVSWWKDEEFSLHNLIETIENLKKYNNKVDYVISHCPTNEMIDNLKELFTQCGEQVPYFLKNKLQYTNTSSNLQEIENKAQYKMWFCGHLHIDEQSRNYCCIYEEFIEI